MESLKSCYDKVSHLFIKIVSFLSILLLIWIHCPTSCHLDLSLKTYFSVNTYPSLTHSLSFFFFLSFFLSFFLFPRRCGKHVVTHVMNPKSMHRERLLGHMDIDTREWTDGVLTDTVVFLFTPIIKLITQKQKREIKLLQ